MQSDEPQDTPADSPSDRPFECEPGGPDEPMEPERVRETAIAVVRTAAASLEAHPEEEARREAVDRLVAVAAGLVEAGGGRRLVAVSERNYPEHPAEIDGADDGRAAAARAVDGAILATATARLLTDSRARLVRVGAASLFLGLSEWIGALPQTSGPLELVEDLDVGGSVDGNRPRMSTGNAAEEEPGGVLDSEMNLGATFDFDADGVARAREPADEQSVESRAEQSTAGMSVALAAAPDPESVRRAVVVFEADWLLVDDRASWPHGPDYRPSIEGMVVAQARRWVELRSGAADVASARAEETPCRPQQAFEVMQASADNLAEHVLVTMVLGAVGFLARGMAVELVDGRRAVVVEPAERPEDYLSPLVAVDAAGEAEPVEGRPGLTDGFGPVAGVRGFGGGRDDFDAQDDEDKREGGTEAASGVTTAELESSALSALLSDCSEPDGETADSVHAESTSSMSEATAWDLIADCAGEPDAQPEG